MSVMIGLHVLEMLNGNAKLKELCGDSIYPVAAVQGTESLPFVVFECDTDQPDYTADGVAGDTHTVTIDCVSKDYKQTLVMADAVRRTLELQTAEYPESGFEVTDCRLVSCKDGWIDEREVYDSTIIFTMESAEL